MISSGDLEMSATQTSRRVRRSLLSVNDIDDSEMHRILRRSAEIKSNRAAVRDVLAGKCVGVYFRATSTRTRTSFTLGAQLLGAETVVYGPSDLQVNTGESLADTGRVLGGYLDVLVVRAAGSHDAVKSLDGGGTLPVINAMNDEEHPTQALSDLFTLQEERGALDGIKFLYVGEGNNTATALALSLSRFPGSEVTFLTPAGYGLPEPILRKAGENASAHEARIRELHNPDDFKANVDVVYTTRWQTTGTSKPDPNWRRDFAPFQVTTRLFERVSNGGNAILMHDLPAVRGEDVDSALLDGPRSIAFRQGHNKLYAAMALLEWIVESGPCSVRQGRQGQS